MKILFLSHATYMVALPKIIEQAEMLAGMGNEVTLVATSTKNVVQVDTFTKNGVRYIITPSILMGKYRNGADLYDALIRSLYIVKNFDFDIMHAIDSRPTVILPALYIRKRKKIPLVLEWSDLFSDGGTIRERSSKLYEKTFGKVESFFETAFRNYADGATAITSFLQNKLIELGYDERKILIHRLGCIIDEKRLMPKKTARTKLNVSSSAIMIGFIGKIYPRDYELLIESFKLFRRKNNYAQLIFVGGIDNKLKIRHPGVFYTGFLDGDEFKYYCNAFDFFVLPLKRNKMNTARWPSKMNDYLSYSKPIVSTEVSDFKEMFVNNNIGFLTNDTPEAFAAGMEKMIQNKDEWETMGHNAYRFAQDNLDWNIICDKLLHFYENIAYNGAVEERIR